MNRQLLFLYFMLVVSVGYLVSALSLGDPLSESGLTPSFFPILVGMAAIIFSTILIVQKLRATDSPTEAHEAGSYTHIWVSLAILAYIAAFRTLGYFLSSGLFVFALIVLFSSFEKLVLKALIASVIVGLAYVMFQQLFGVRLPTLWG